MNTIGIICLLLSLSSIQAETVVQNETHTETETTNYGPITMVVNNLAEIAINVSDETTGQLQSKMERTVQDITGNLEVLTTDAMAQLSDAIYETNQLLVGNPSCNPAWNLDELTANITDQLGACTFGLGSLVDSFRQEGQQSLTNVQGFVQQIAQLPSLCQMLGQSTELAPLNPLGFAGGNNCFINGMVEINKGMAQTLHNASLLLVRTRQLSEEQVAQAQQCSDSVVQQIRQFLSDERANCEAL
ncbi:uncharacterized protein LOC108154342 [Drosophila miranda]|uniref:uncharacterized protein LOC108154342 n=1 Tax=Drosophila miranda TaxID=7229 RepID=UPI0007E69668|nr:uncharacterized protein LOC108154342 [Drosophila miranda]